MREMQRKRKKVLSVCIQHMSSQVTDAVIGDDTMYDHVFLIKK